jgi:hypothetical protein
MEGSLVTAGQAYIERIFMYGAKSGPSLMAE